MYLLTVHFSIPLRICFLNGSITFAFKSQETTRSLHLQWTTLETLSLLMIATTTLPVPIAIAKLASTAKKCSTTNFQLLFVDFWEFCAWSLRWSFIHIILDFIPYHEHLRTYFIEHRVYYAWQLDEQEKHLERWQHILMRSRYNLTRKTRHLNRKTLYQVKCWFWRQKDCDCRMQNFRV